MKLIYFVIPIPISLGLIGIMTAPLWTPSRTSVKKTNPTFEKKWHEQENLYVAAIKDWREHGPTDEAEQTMRTLIAQGHDPVRMRIELAGMLAEQGKLSEAHQLYKASLHSVEAGTFASNGVVLANAAIAAEAAGDSSEASWSLDKMQGSSIDSKFKVAAKSAKVQHLYGSALRFYSKALRADPHDQEAAQGIQAMKAAQTLDVQRP